MKRLASLLSCLFLAAALTSCGSDSKKIVSDLEFETRDQDSEKFVVTDFIMELGNAELPFLHLPLPRNYGYLRFYRVDGINRVAVDVNLTEILKLPRGNEATLPNGTMLPVDTMGAGVIEIPVSGINGKVYISHKDDMTLIGFAASIKQLDDIGSEMGTIGVFPNFDISGVNVTAGIYTSPAQGQTGLAVFANIGSLWSESTLASNYDRDTFRAIPQRNPRWKERRLGRRLLRLKNTQQLLDIAK
tara:strand:+ start:845 stop:1579 length:735 start_codon:yes stop_codon:yes gene_type:complete